MIDQHKRIKNFTLLAFTLVVLASCGKDEVLQGVDIGQDYFPVNQGSSITYKVDSIVWNDFYTPVQVDTFSFYIRMMVDDTFTDDEGRTAYYYRKYYRNDTSTWQLIKNHALVKTSQHVETKEDNFTFVKIAFPVNSTTTWDMNSKNALDPTSSYFFDYHIPYTINGNSFDSTAVVIHKDLETLIGKDYHKEIYAKHLGLIYREEIAIEKESNGQWKNGYSLLYTLLSYD